MLKAAMTAILLAAPAAGAQQVDLELVLLADATGSIDDAEIRLQREGYAGALTDSEVLWAIRNGGALGRVAVTYVEWANATSQDVVVDRTVIADEADARAFGATQLQAPRLAYGSNAIGAALLKGLALIEGNGFEGGRKVIDLSADSSWNGDGPSIAAARDIVLGSDVVINGLAILCRGDCSGRPRAGDLEAEFAGRLIGGPGAFVVTAEDGPSFARAVRRKLILEIASSAGSGTPAPVRP
jgi:hypothetical protein